MSATRGPPSRLSAEWWRGSSPASPHHQREGEVAVAVVVALAETGGGARGGAAGDPRPCKCGQRPGAAPPSPPLPRLPRNAILIPTILSLLPQWRLLYF